MNSSKPVDACAVGWSGAGQFVRLYSSLAAVPSIVQSRFATVVLQFEKTTEALPQDATRSSYSSHHITSHHIFDLGVRTNSMTCHCRILNRCCWRHDNIGRSMYHDESTHLKDYVWCKLFGFGVTTGTTRGGHHKALEVHARASLEPHVSLIRSSSGYNEIEWMIFQYSTMFQWYSSMGLSPGHLCLRVWNQIHWLPWSFLPWKQTTSCINWIYV
jgi:hypothetical protein